MRTLSKLIMLFAIAAIAPYCSAIAADTGADQEFYVNTYRSIGTVKGNSSRSRAMGGAGRGLADGVASVGVNPAALGAFTDRGYEIGVGYDWLDDGASDANQYSFRLGGAISLESIRPTGGCNQALGGLLQTESFSGAGDIGMKKSQTSITAAYGLHVLPDLLAGASVSLIDGSWKSRLQTGSTVNLDRDFLGGEFKVGGLYRITDITTIGGTLAYGTASNKERAAYAAGAKSGSLDRWSVGFGVAHQIREPTLVLADVWYDHLKTDVPGIVEERNKSWGISAGVEQEVLEDLLALRGGLYYAKNSYKSTGSVNLIEGGDFSKGRFGITAGAGLRLYSFELGYSLDINSGGDVSNLLDFSADW
ncbi:MAG: hypothetical protein LIP23_08460 [Planctomycetes bacterium]|nr:hypothetical protein [Planctomycetota bacterium]